jgi:hypothetical protein
MQESTDEAGLNWRWAPAIKSAISGQIVQEIECLVEGCVTAKSPNRGRKSAHPFFLYGRAWLQDKTMWKFHVFASGERGV